VAAQQPVAADGSLRCPPAEPERRFITTATMTEPPYVLDSARVLAYAVLDQTVSYTGRISVYVGGKLLPPVPRLAICENLAREGDFLLCYCTETWEVLGVGGYESFELAKQRAEIAYTGVSDKWKSASCRARTGVYR